jgi:hypothetical protein
MSADSGLDQPATKTRWQIDVEAPQLARLQSLMERCSLKTRKDLFDNAMTLFQWAVTQVENGNDIASYDPSTGIVRPVLLTALQNVPERNRERKFVGVRVAAAEVGVREQPSGSPTRAPAKEKLSSSG